ncbi:MAG: cation:proton antiporter [Desulfobulbaceae bacterium]|uniref:Cation:proton antiporter n=1 Tax=Candidatus Desulfobia pelagia TaxID=2841692 RepID=A0A8J6NFD7_9BACT|nr:cation:proton antiporter [Candidatus Desulfobia pelagia]
MTEVTLGLAILLSVGLLFAKLGQKIKLPSVTGYILAGLLLGSGGLNIISQDVIGDQLEHFTQIALMLIAFGIGEHIELTRLRKAVRSIGLIAVLEGLGAFLIVAVSVYLVAPYSHLNSGSWLRQDYFILAILLGSIAIATAPATILHVTRELRASGPLTSTLMTVVAINNGVAIMIFGFALTVATQLVGDNSNAMSMAFTSGIIEISLALLMGVTTGLLLDFILPRLKRQDEMLTAGLALLLLCGESCRMFDLSPLLAGMAAGFIIVNKDTRDVRLFRILNSFEPPIYVLFFTLAGLHLHVEDIGMAGWVGVAYFLSRIIGKMAGAYTGARLTGACRAVQNYLGMALIPQAGVAIGLIFLISGKEELSRYAQVIIPVVLTTVVLTELFGPLGTRFAIVRSGESREQNVLRPECDGLSDKSCDLWHQASHGINIVPWTWQKLIPPAESEGFVAFGASNLISVPGLARIATLLANHFKAIPLSVRIVKPGTIDHLTEKGRGDLFRPEREEVEQLGYTLETELIQYDGVADALVSAVEYNAASAVVLGFPVEGTFQGFQQMLETVARHVLCPVVLVRFYGALHTERILVPLVDTKELKCLAPVILALSKIGEHRLTFLTLLHPGATAEEVEEKREELAQWTREHDIAMSAGFDVICTDARQETIVAEANNHDLLVMGASRKSALQKLFFGSLAETVAQKCRKPLLIVYHPDESDIIPGYHG